MFIINQSSRDDFFTVGYGIVVTYNNVAYNKTGAGQTWITFIIGMMWCNVGNTMIISYISKN